MTTTSLAVNVILHQAKPRVSTSLTFKFSQHTSFIAYESRPRGAQVDGAKGNTWIHLV